MELDGSGKLTDDAKIQGLGQTGANVRFVVCENYVAGCVEEPGTV